MTPSQAVDFTGQCLCGAIRFRGRSAPDPDLRACHCSQCRRWSGHVWASFDTETLTFESADSLRWFASSETAERGFCATCGSSLFWRSKGSDTIEVAPGALNLPTGLRLAGHIFTAFKGDYYNLPEAEERA